MNGISREDSNLTRRDTVIDFETTQLDLDEKETYIRALSTIKDCITAAAQKIICTVPPDFDSTQNSCMPIKELRAYTVAESTLPAPGRLPSDIYIDAEGYEDPEKTDPCAMDFDAESQPKYRTCETILPGSIENSDMNAGKGTSCDDKDSDFYADNLLKEFHVDDEEDESEIPSWRG